MADFVKLSGDIPLRETFIKYLKKREDVLQYEHSFLYANKHLSPTEVALQLENRRQSSLFFSDFTMYLLGDALNMKCTMISSRMSTSSFRFESQNPMSILDSDYVALVADGTFFHLKKDLVLIGNCPLVDFFRHELPNGSRLSDDTLDETTTVIGINGRGTF